MSFKSLQDKIDRSGNLVEELRNEPAGAYSFPVVPAEFSNWRDEQYAWSRSVALLDQTHHMTYEYMRGPDVLKLLALVGANSFKGFAVDKAKQLVCVSPDGYHIGDGILFYLAEEELLYVGRPILANWLRYNAAANNFSVDFERDNRSPANTKGKAVVRTLYRYQLQGPLAEKLIAKLNGGSFPDIKFFNMGYINIGGRRVRALHHGMVGAKGLEIWGPYEDGEAVKDAILEAGEEFGIRQVGSLSYPVTALASAWIPSAMPAIYTGEAMRPYREWLAGDSYEATATIGGSFVSDRIEDYYISPFELGYGHFLKFDHDFIGRDALERMNPAEQRRKVTFEWNSEDVGAIMASILNPEGENYKFIDLPVSKFAFHQYDMVSTNAKGSGLALYTGFDYNFRAMLSTGVVDPSVSIGDDVTLLWGEPDGGTRKVTVERHKQFEVRAKVAAAPYSRVAREEYGHNRYSTGS